jgi:hypothetical protein
VDAFPDRPAAFHEENRVVEFVLEGPDLKFHRYQFLEPSPHVQDLLDHTDSGGDPIFWG